MGGLVSKSRYTTPIYEVCLQTKRGNDTRCTIWLPDALNVCTDLKEALCMLENIRKGVEIGKDDKWRLIQLDAIIWCGHYFGVVGEGKVIEDEDQFLLKTI